MEHGGLRLAAKGREVLRGASVTVAAEAPRPIPSAAGEQSYDIDLFERLRALRREIADAADLPRWWPAQTLPNRILRTISLEKLPAPHGPHHMLVQSIAGLAAKAVNEGRGGELVWVTSTHRDLEAWLDRFRADHDAWRAICAHLGQRRIQDVIAALLFRAAGLEVVAGGAEQPVQQREPGRAGRHGHDEPVQGALALSSRSHTSRTAPRPPPDVVTQ